MSVQSINTPNIDHKRSLRNKKPNTAMPNYKSKIGSVTSTLVPEESKESKDWFKKSIPVQTTSTHKKKSGSQELKVHYEDYSKTHLTNIPILSIADRVKLRKTRNLATVSKTSEDSGKKLRSIKSEFVYTPSIVRTRITRSSKLNTNCVNTPKKLLKKIFKHEAKKTTTAVPSKYDLLKIPFSIKNENSSTPQIFYTSELNRFDKNSPLHTNISTTSILKHEEVCQVRNCPAKLSTNICIHKKVSPSYIKANVKYGLNGNQMPKGQKKKIR